MILMDVETKIDLVKSEPTEEIITESELKTLFETKSRPKHYIGFEISGMPHIGHILVAGKKINDLEKAGVETQVLLADWHTMANNKLGGNWEKIIKVSDFYRRLFREVCPKTKIILGSDLYKDNNEYWKLIMQMARRTTIARATRTLIIQGRSEKDTLHVSQYIYPIMQSVDIHALGADIPHAGMDQRKVHMLAKELFKDMNLGTIVPLHHHLLPSLTEPPKIDGSAEKEEVVAAMKMSKSKPGSAIPILTTEEEIRGLIKGSWCPEGVVDENPLLQFCKFVIFPSLGRLEIERGSKYGGDVEYDSYSKLEGDYAQKKLHPIDLKGGVSDALISLIMPIARKFEKEKEDLKKLF
jgi:tyrosyl-tRNA synthetase